ncbi:hypothetical protein RISK_004409 [Rhodopirellula islandica]|uniref:Uncharacterized protein n=1 Tax=Rhodopirellula islandica TaxID=595434 RepID=A0A0J1B9W1_RHOIS|nr:hypothetical protein RISK_004409 [Rhodopirellula islandica]
MWSLAHASGCESLQQQGVTRWVSFAVNNAILFRWHLRGGSV